MSGFEDASWFLPAIPIIAISIAIPNSSCITEAKMLAFLFWNFEKDSLLEK